MNEGRNECSLLGRLGEGRGSGRPGEVMRARQEAGVRLQTCPRPPVMEAGVWILSTPAAFCLDSQCSFFFWNWEPLEGQAGFTGTPSP